LAWPWGLPGEEKAVPWLLAWRDPISWACQEKKSWIKDHLNISLRISYIGKAFLALQCGDCSVDIFDDARVLDGDYATRWDLVPGCITRVDVFFGHHCEQYLM
jgi:hypothetical protein